MRRNQVDKATGEAELADAAYSAVTESRYGLSGGCLAAMVIVIVLVLGAVVLLGIFFMQLSLDLKNNAP